MFGIVISLKEVFGFLQPFLPVPGEEHLYFTRGQEGGEGLQEGDEVQFSVRSGPRGLVAAGVQRLEGGVKEKRSQVRGVVQKEADQYKFSPGILLLSTNNNTEDPSQQQQQHQVPYMPADVSKSSRRIMKGDEVEFDLYVIPPPQAGRGGGYRRGHAIRLVRTRSDILIAEQIQELERSGAAREHGVIDTIKNDFGFVRPCDRPEQIFFRLEDVLDKEQHLPNEGDEISFFVISETVKGRVSDRAVHLKFLPHGTAQFEETLGTSSRAVVVLEPRLLPREEPGQLKLFHPLQPSSSSSSSSNPPAIPPVLVESVELWSRCLPEGLQLKCGDEVCVDVTKYRPEKLIFARNVKVFSFRGLGRVFGSVCDVKAAGGYGFIRSAQGDPDSYFRVSEVLEARDPNTDANADAGTGSVFLPEKRIRSGLLVSYEIVMEAVRGGGGGHKLRAIRVQACSEADFHPRKAVLQRDMTGTVVREARKGDRDGVGSLQLSEESEATLNLAGEAMACPEVLASQQDLFCALQDFRDNSSLQEVVVGHFMPFQRYALHSLLRHHFTGIAHETIDPSPSSSKSSASASSSAGKKSKGGAEQSEEGAGVQLLSLTESNLNAVTQSVATASAAANSNANNYNNNTNGDNNNNNNDSPSKTRGGRREAEDRDKGDRRREVRIWKINDPQEFAQWSEANNALFEESNRWCQQAKEKEGTTNTNARNNKNVISFQKSDLIDSLSSSSGGGGGGGGARTGSDVIFDVCIDRVTGFRVAANVRVSDLQAVGGEWPQLGALEYIRSTGGSGGGGGGEDHGGYIRCVPSNEKLMWNQPVTSEEEQEGQGQGGGGGSAKAEVEWRTGSAVSFEIRVRGGVRYAAGVAVLPADR